MRVKCYVLYFDHIQVYKISHVGNLCGAPGIDFQEGPLAGSGGSENNEVKNVNSQKYLFKRSQDTPKNLNFSSSNVSLITD
jgi:hypothetical protein